MEIASFRSCLKLQRPSSLRHAVTRSYSGERVTAVQFKIEKLRLDEMHLYGRSRDVAGHALPRRATEMLSFWAWEPG